MYIFIEAEFSIPPDNVHMRIFCHIHGYNFAGETAIEYNSIYCECSKSTFKIRNSLAIFRKMRLRPIIAHIFVKQAR